MVEVTNEQLLEQARIAWSRAYAKYSKYKVGAAVLTKDGKIILGCKHKI
jgi:cytidine deaminase